MWQPTSTLQALKTRADLYRRIRFFFDDRKVLEVETPCLAAATITDPYIDSLTVPAHDEQAQRFLQTSPEYFMKRLLASGSGDIYQIAKVFRQEEQGRFHNEEFTMLEWYRLDVDLWELMEEVADLVEQLLGCSHFQHISYRDVFEQHLGFDPHEISLESLTFEAKQQINIEMPKASKDDWLNLMMSHFIEPELGRDAPVFIYDYPPSQAALATINTDESGVAVAERFELYYKGIELANGFNELTDAAAQKERFHQDNMQRMAMLKKPLPIDYDFLAALEHGLPACSGVALGMDRVLMLKLKAENIAQVLSFR